MPLDFDIIGGSRPPWERWSYCSTPWLDYNPLTETRCLEMLGLNNTERTEKKMEVRDKICDKCGKRYSVADMRVLDKNGAYTDKECYIDNNTPIEDYPKMYHSRTDERYVGRGMDLCPDCAEALKKFAGERI